MNRPARAWVAVLATLTFLVAGAVGAAPAQAATPSIRYQAHVQDRGWQPAVTDGATAGTVGHGLRLEALAVSLSGGGGVTYRTHVQDVGWTAPVAGGSVSGSTGRGLRVEALSMQLTGEVSRNHDLYYRVHVQNTGWLGWAANGAVAGTQGVAVRVEAVQVRLVAKGAAAPGSTARPSFTASVAYSTHVQNLGWTGEVANRAVAGTTGRSLRVEALRLRLRDQPFPGGIEYSVHVQDVGWQGYRSNGAAAGTTGQSRRVEAVRIRLTGQMADRLSVYYRVHVQNYGWLGWTRDGDPSGTAGAGYRVEAVQVAIQGKGNGPWYGTEFVEYAPPASNGNVDPATLCNIGDGWLLRCDAGAAFGRMNAAFRARFGHPIPLEGTYRAYYRQVELYREIGPGLAARPGTSQHGWGLAIDVTERGAYDFGTPRYEWLRTQGPAFGWSHPSWARQGGGREEPWHFEFAG
ncbi:hydrophobic protein [Xylanimonas cellulosilytica DSM 15894]|uniref:Hydrophobic protein n=1 Tax=Xylanimonas cellulosilytica (strain DSM 15894 / JCM 12276 / CECT 5975 / KCTC 9989 / LMG 20990 / NBRC 107835 / XIL07) TaxID=446471 RepID=D1BWJ0_XYLCX|nr:D-alanyl-D-alanine carboxypeptidase family protein [Xylanimonas cellulosilytica]ACZ31535.1 hydrophobic protein [Xylanimonas cellulosilytica DSM 15894]